MKREFSTLEEQHKRLKQERKQLKRRCKTLRFNRSEQSEEHERLLEEIEQEITQKKNELKSLGELLEKKRKPLKWKETLKWLQDEQKCLVSCYL